MKKKGPSFRTVCWKIQNLNLSVNSFSPLPPTFQGFWKTKQKLIEEDLNVVYWFELGSTVFSWNIFF